MVGFSRRGIWLGVSPADWLVFLFCSQNTTLSHPVYPPQWDRTALPDIGFKVGLPSSPVGGESCVVYWFFQEHDSRQLRCYQLLNVSYKISNYDVKQEWQFHIQNRRAFPGRLSESPMIPHRVRKAIAAYTCPLHSPKALHPLINQMNCILRGYFLCQFGAGCYLLW